MVDILLKNGRHLTVMVPSTDNEALQPPYVFRGFRTRNIRHQRVRCGLVPQVLDNPDSKPHRFHTPLDYAVAWKVEMLKCLAGGKKSSLALGGNVASKCDLHSRLHRMYLETIAVRC